MIREMIDGHAWKAMPMDGSMMPDEGPYTGTPFHLVRDGLVVADFVYPKSRDELKLFIDGFETGLRFRD